jgi:uncharacterized OsmC-like protein
MKISATLKNKFDQNEMLVETDANSKNISIPSKATGYGSSVNGAELLLLALATCFCNDLYREANKNGIAITGVEVKVTGDFDAEGQPGSNFQYKAVVNSDADAQIIEELIKHTDKVAEIQNTLRKGVNITLLN